MGGASGHLSATSFRMSSYLASPNATEAASSSAKYAVCASTPAVVNAVVDAVRHLGVNDVQMPCTPERVWRALKP